MTDTKFLDMHKELPLDSKIVQINSNVGEPSEYAFQVKVETPDGKRFWLSAVMYEDKEEYQHARLVMHKAVG